MSLSTLPPTVQGAGDDFDDWERELSPTYRPSRAAERRTAREQIETARFGRRRRTHEREV